MRSGSAASLHGDRDDVSADLPGALGAHMLGRMRSFEHDGDGPRVVFGPGARHRVGAELDRLGVGRALLLSTPGHAKAASRLADQLGDAVADVFAGAVMHTPVAVTDEALRRVDAAGVDSVVSFGGGSTTGLGKAIAARTGLPHLVIPTTYAGSEVTPILGETADGEKVTRSGPEIVPDTVVYDVELTMTLPWAVTVTSAVNAMAHAVEALYGEGRTADTDHAATEALRVLTGGLRTLDGERDDAEARSDLLYGAWLAGRCLAVVGMGLHHKLCHTLGGTFGLPHAGTHTVVLPHAVAYNEPAAPDAIAAVAEAVRVTDAATGLQDLIRGWGGPISLAGLGFSDADVPRAATLATARPYPNPRPVTRDGIVALLGRATTGQPPSSDVG